MRFSIRDKAGVQLATEFQIEEAIARMHRSPQAHCVVRLRDEALLATKLGLYRHLGDRRAA